MNTLSENILKAKKSVDTLDELIRQTESSLITQKTVCEQAEKDNAAKRKFNDLVNELINWNPDLLCSVMIKNDELEAAFAPLKSLRDKINSQNVSYEEQKQKLETFESKIHDFTAQRQQDYDLLTSYKLQLKVEINKQKQELANLESLLNSSFNNQ